MTIPETTIPAVHIPATTIPAMNIGGIHYPAQTLPAVNYPARVLPGRTVPASCFGADTYLGPSDTSVLLEGYEKIDPGFSPELSSAY